MRNNDKNELTIEIEERHKRRNIKWLLVLYDWIIFTIVAFIFLFINNGYRQADLLVHYFTALIPIFTFRFIGGVYTQIWRYGGIQSYIRLLLADFAGCLVYSLIDQLIGAFWSSVVVYQWYPIALAIISLNTLAALAIRMIYRYCYKICDQNNRSGKFARFLIVMLGGKSIVATKRSATKKIKVAIVGAGRTGVGLAQELMESPTSAYLPRMFVDTSKEKVGRRIFDLPVYQEGDNVKDALIKHEIQEVIFALPNMPVEEKRGLYEKYQEMGCKVKVYDVPVIANAEGTGIKKLRDFDAEELLFRRELIVVDKKTRNYYKHKIVMITGGGGSIGSELARQIAKMNPKAIVIVDICENGAYDLQQELKLVYKNDVDVFIEIVSVCNKRGLEKVFQKYHPEIVLHAAAHKHVPLMENNCCEAVINNVFGTKNTVELAEQYQCERFIMVSTDKAVNPTNVMGATKRMCEMVVLSHAKKGSKTIFSATRFGNVLGSAGSVIPLFKKQIANGGPITLTDKRIIRYFMTIPEASQLVLESGMMANDGELFVLDMGKPVKILELAENMILLSGYKPYVDIDIIETGLRPGEKLYEELLIKSESLSKTSNSLIFVEQQELIDKKEIENKLDILAKAVDTEEDNTVRDALHQVVPTFKTPEEVNRLAESSSEMASANDTKQKNK